MTINVHLKTDYDAKLDEDSITISGIRYLSSELLIVLGLAENQPSLEDVIAILIVQRKKLDWDKLTSLCEEYSTSRYLATLLELLNFESSRILFYPKRIKNIAVRADKKVRLDFPFDKKSEPPDDTYSEISSKWNVVPHVRRSFLSKLEQIREIKVTTEEKDEVIVEREELGDLGKILHQSHKMGIGLMLIGGMRWQLTPEDTDTPRTLISLLKNNHWEN